MAILMAVAVPSFQSTLDENRLSGKAAEWTAAVHTARAEAQKRGARARVTLTPNAQADWTAGWTVFVDATANANGGVSPTSAAPNGNTILLVTEALPSRVKVDAGSTLTYVSFVGSGDAVITPAAASASGYDKTQGGYLRGSLWFKAGSGSRCLKLVAPGVVDLAINMASCA